MSAIIVALMTSSLTWTATALHRLNVTSQLSTHLALSPTPLTRTSGTADVIHPSPTIVSNLVLTRHSLAAPTKPSPDAVDRQPLNVNEAPFSSTNTTTCRLGNVDVDYDGGTITSRLDNNCRMPIRRGAKSSHAADPVSVIFKSFFKIQNKSSSPELLQSKLRGKLLLHDEKWNSSHVLSTALASVKQPARDGHEFLWTVDTSGNYEDVLDSDRRRSAGEEVDRSSTNGCAWSQLSDDISSYDCTMALTDAGNNLTINESRNDDDYYSFTAGEMVSVVAVGTILSAICLATVVGNALVLVAIISNGHLRGTTHYFMANLALADLLLGVSVLPFSATLETIDRWVFGETFCDVWAAIDVLCCTASILSLCVISVDRYVGVTRPLQHSAIMSERRAGWVIVAVWLLSLAISVAPLFGWKEPREPGSDPEICDVTKQTGYVLFSVAGSFYIPLSVILVVYYRVYREAVRQSRFLTTGIKTTDSDYSGSSSEVTLRIHTGRLVGGSGDGGAGSRKGSVAVQDVGHHRPAHLRITVAGRVAKFKREKKAAKTLGIVVGVFVLCWFPFFFVLPLGEYCISSFIHSFIHSLINTTCG